MFVFLFTDIEGSTRLWEEHTGAMSAVIARHDEILREEVEGNGGRITKHTGDGITAAFEAGEPVACALEVQKRFAAEAWGAIGELRIRIGIHAGEAEYHASAGTPDGDYFGPPVNCTARIMSAAWGGQILLTPQVTSVSPLPAQATVLDLGEHLLKNVAAPQQLYQLLHPQLPRHDFPPPRTLSVQSIREAVDQRGEQIVALEPQAMVSALVAVMLLPALQGDLDPRSGALEGNLGVLEDLGAVSLRGFVAGFAARLQAGERLPPREIQTILQRELQSEWQARGERALALRTDASRLLQAVHGVEAAMAAATDEVKEALARGLAVLGTQFGEFRWMLAGVQDTLAEMRARQALQLALQREQLDLQRQQLVKTNLLLHRRREVLPIAEAAVAGEVDAEPPAHVPCPYKGLAAFEADDAQFFFGREGLVAELTARLAGTRFLAVVGPSGSGKSSLVRAGLLPAIWGGALPASGEWQTLLITPGAHPFEELAVRISLLNGFTPDEVLRSFETDPRALNLVVKRLLDDQPQDVQLLLVVDQFEEVFALCRDEVERRRFIESLLHAVEADNSRVVVVPTIRADFYGRCADYPELAAKLRENLLVGPMAADELCQAMERPAAVVGLGLEPGLVDTILNDVAGEPGALPLMSHALVETWERRRGRTLTLAGYAASGGVAGAIAQTADSVYTGLEPGDQALARHIFLRLTELGEEGSQDTRRRVAPAELVRSAEEAPAVEALLKKLADVRLITTGENQVEVAHEALIREWPVLRGWLEQDREGLRIHRHLTDAAGEWERLGREPGELYRGARLATAGEWAKAYGEALNPLEWEFLAASQELAHRREVEREAQRQRELEAAQKLAAEQEKRADVEQRRAEEQTRSAGRLRQGALLLAGASVLAIILAVAAFYAFRQANQSAHSAQVASTQAVSEKYVAETAQAREEDQRATADAEGWARATQQTVAKAETNARATQQALAEKETRARATQQALAEGQARLATSRELSLAAQNDLQVDPERSMLLALQAISLARTTQAEAALRQAVAASRVRLTTENMEALVESIAYSPDGSRLATSIWDGTAGTVFVRDATSGEVILTVPGEMVAYSPDGARLATATDDGTVTVRDAASGQELLTLTGHSQYLGGLVFSPDGAYLATGSEDGTVRVWDGTTGQEVLTLPMPEGHVVFSPGGKHLITVDNDTVGRVWDLATGEALLVLPGRGPIAVSPDGKLLVTVGAKTTDRLKLVLWDLEASLASGSGQAISSVSVHENLIVDVAFSPDGSRLATGSQDRTAKVWTISPEGIQESMTLAGHSGTVYDLAFSPDGRFLATGSNDGTARIWDISPSGNQELLTVAGHLNSLRRVAYSPDGARLVTTNGDGQAVILDAVTGETLLTFPHPAGVVWEAAFSPDGTRLATAGEDNTARVWDATNGQELLTFTGHAEAPLVGNLFAGIMAVDFSPDGKQLASAGADGRALIWDVETGEIVLALQVHPAGIGATMVVFSTDGTRLAAASDSREGAEPLVGVWDLASGQELYTVTGLPIRAHTLAFSPDGAKLAIGEYGDFVKVYDAASGEEVLSLTGDHTRVLAVAFSPDSALLATGGAELPKLWDLATGQELATFPGHTSMVNGLAFNPDGSRLASSSIDGTTRVYAVDVEELIALAQSRLTRWWSSEECGQYLHTEECPPEP